MSIEAQEKRIRQYKTDLVIEGLRRTMESVMKLSKPVFSNNFLCIGIDNESQQIMDRLEKELHEYINSNYSNIIFSREGSQIIKNQNADWDNSTEQEF